MCIYNLNNSSDCITTLEHNAAFNGCQPSTLYLLFEGICVYTKSALYDQEYDHADLVHALMILNSLSVLVFLLGIWWIRQEQLIDITEIKSLSRRASDYTIKCNTAPFIDYFREKKYNFEDYNHLSKIIKEFFESMLSNYPYVMEAGTVQVADVNLSSTCYQYLESACQRGNISVQIDKIINQCVAVYRSQELVKNSKSLSFSHLKNQLRKALYEFEISSDACMRLQVQALQQINRAFITFETDEGYKRCLKAYQSQEFDQVLRSKTSLVVQPAEDPSEIIWENFGYPTDRRLLRIIATTVALIIILAVSYLLIFEVQYAV